MTMKRHPRTSHAKRRPTYELLEPRCMLTGDIQLTDLRSGVAVADDATGIGHIMYSEADVHTRFSGVPTNNSDHFIATRLDGIQWQYNNDTDWIDFTPVESDLLVAEVNFDVDKVSRIEVSDSQNYYYYRSTIPTIVETIEAGFIGEDLRFAADRFGNAVDDGEFQVLGSSFSRPDAFVDLTPSENKLEQLSTAALRYEAISGDFPRAASLADDGTPLLSWRVHLLPLMGLQNLYDQFNLDEPWDSTNNLPLASQMPDVFASPHFSSSTETSFLAVTGSGTMFPEFGNEVTFGQITDGTHTTLLFVEADADQAVVWTKPGDLSFDPANPLAGLGNIAPEGFAAVTVDRSAYTLPATIDPVNFTNMAIRNDGNFVDFSEFGPYFESTEVMREITLATLNFESAYMRFPRHAMYADDGGTPLLSWRVTILPFLGYNELYSQFNLDEPWDSPHNLSLLPMMPKLYAHPAVANGMTNFLGVSGPGTIFELSSTFSTRFANISDGSSNTILLVEADADQAVEWTKPEDFLINTSNPKAGLGGINPGSFNVAFADGTVREVDSTIDDANFLAMLTRAGGEVPDFSLVESPWSTGSQLRNVALASLNFESAFMHFPKHGTYSATGEPLLSWRVQILPFIEQNNLYSMFHHDEPWDSPHNLSLLPLMPQIYQTEGVANGFTVIQGSNGPGTMFPLSDTNISFGSIIDGPQNTALYMQVDNDRAIEWTRPLDLAFNPGDPGDGLGGTLASGFHFVTTDGATQFYNNALDEADLAYLLQRNDGVAFTDEFVETESEIPRNANIHNKLRQIALSAINYESAHMEFPSHAIYSEQSDAGTPLLSWRVNLLQFMGENALYNAFHLDEPWDSPHNLSLIPLMPDFYAHPLVENGKTVFQAVTTPDNTGDPESMFPLTWRGNISFGNIPDGSSNTILFVESNLDQAVEWTKPDDLLFDPLDPAEGTGLGDAYFGYGFRSVFADGSTHFLRHCLPDETIAALILRDDGEVVSDYKHSNYGCDSQAAATIANSFIAYGNGVEATDKSALLPGQTATFENYTSYIDGITSLSVDIGRLGNSSALSMDDFVLRTGNGSNSSDFTEIGFTPTLTISPGIGTNESTRVTLEFPAGSITNTWLQVNILANENTGLESDSTFYFGNAIGETGDNPNNAIVNLIDVARARVNQSGFSTVGADDPYDINRDGRVNLVDVALIRSNQSGFSALNLITAPVASNRSADVASGSKSNETVAVAFSTPDFSSSSFRTSRLPIGTASSLNDLANREQANQNVIPSREYLAAKRTNLEGSVERGAVERFLESEFKSNDHDLFDPLDSLAGLDQIIQEDLTVEIFKSDKATI